jgi:hypothetical protein
VIASVLLTAVPTMTSIIVGGIIAAVGELLRIWTAGYGYQIGDLMVKGPYRFVRHPYLLGSGLLFLGLSIAGREPFVCGATMILLIAVYRYDAVRDERRLARTLGPAFHEFADRVPAFLPAIIPDLKLPSDPRSFSFRYSMVLGRHRELNAVIVGLVIAGMLYLAATLTEKIYFHIGALVVLGIYMLARLVYFSFLARR